MKKTTSQDHQTGYLERSKRTPSTEADVLLTNLEDAYRRLVIERNGNKKLPKEMRLEDCKLHETAFFKEQVGPDALTGDAIVKMHREKYPPNQDGVFVIDELQSIVIALTYCIEAIRADCRGERDLAWTYIVDARTWFATSLHMKPKRINNIENRRSTSFKRSLAAKKKNEMFYQPHIDFILTEYRAGFSQGLWINPHQALDELSNRLTDQIRDKKLQPMSDENRRDWIYSTLLRHKP